MEREEVWECRHISCMWKPAEGGRFEGASWTSRTYSLMAST